MLLRILIGVFALAVALALYQVYGYRYVLDHVREDISQQTVMGAAQAPINVLAYIDYDSSWSKRANPVLLQIVAQNPDVNILFQPVAGVSASSELMARLILAAKQSGHFLDVHSVLMELPENVDEERMRASIATLGLDYDELKSLATGQDVTRNLEAIKKQIILLNVEQTPHFYVEYAQIPEGGLGYRDFQDFIDDVRIGRR